jgi:small nuclear ribonucleoprotein (snRNP)-like protein
MNQGGNNRGTKRPRSSTPSTRTPSYNTNNNAAAANNNITQNQNPTPLRQIPISLGKPSFRQRLEAYYSLIAPDALVDGNEWNRKFDLIYIKYGGTLSGEEKLAAKLAKKYGSTVRLKVAPDIIAENDARRRQSSLAQSGHEKCAPKTIRTEEFYELNPSQRNSGIVDFTSPNFDPFAALQVSQNEVIRHNPHWTTMNIPLLDNLAKFTTLLPSEDPFHTEQKQSSTIKQDTENTTPSKKPKRTSTLEQLSNQFTVGPLSLLHSIQRQKQRVRVLLRYVDCIRGTVTGYLLAFDKHMNMILRDVDEVYTSRVTSILDGLHLTKEELEVRRRCECIPESDVKEGQERGSYIKLGQRHLHQVLLRGDNVVMVWRADAEKSAFPATSVTPVTSQHHTNTLQVLSKESNGCTRRQGRISTPGCIFPAWEERKRSDKKT